MTERQKIFNIIVEKNYQDAIKAKFNRCYHSVKTEDLAKFVDSLLITANKPKTAKSNTKSERAEYVKYIIDNNLKDDVFRAFGRSYQMVSTDNLHNFIQTYEHPVKTEIDVKPDPTFFEDKAITVLRNLVDLLVERHILVKKDVTNLGIN